MKKIILLTKVGSAERGEKYIQGLHGVPSYYKDTEDDSDNLWWWKEGSEKDDAMFFHDAVIENLLKNKQAQ